MLSFFCFPAEETVRGQPPDVYKRQVYDSLEAHAPLLRPENPAVLFDRAAEQVCRDCPDVYK